MKLGILLVAFCSSLAPTLLAVPPEPAQEVQWFMQIPWPDLRGKPYVEIREVSESGDGPIRGFLISEDKLSWELLCDGTFLQSDEHIYPFTVCRLAKSQRYGKAKSIPLHEAVGEVIAATQKSAGKAKFDAEAPSPAVALFVLARFCERQGSSDLAIRLDRAIPQSGQGDFGILAKDELTYRTVKKALADFRNVSVGRQDLLSQFQRVVNYFPENKHRDFAVIQAEMLVRMIEEDAAHGQTVKSTMVMTPEEKVNEYVFQLRNQTGSPGSMGLSDIWHGQKTGNTPAHELVALGHLAVPALIEALTDQRPSRAVATHISYPYGANVITSGDCAERILEKIAGRTFFPTKAMSEDARRLALQANAREWWAGVRSKGERALLIEGTGKGTHDSVTQAKRLLEMDREVALPALVKGLANAEGRSVEVGLIQVLASDKSEETSVVLTTATRSAQYLDSRVAAARELWNRNDLSGIDPMIEEWKKWKVQIGAGLDHSSPDALICFLAGCGDLAAAKALQDRFASLDPFVRMTVLKALHAFSIKLFRGRRDSIRPEVEAFHEGILVAALDDQSVCSGFGGTRGKFKFSNPRICELAALALNERWPKRYPLQWPDSPAERDKEMRILKQTGGSRLAENRGGAAQ